MNCAKCSGKSTVIDTQKSSYIVRRRRKCTGCGYRWTTHEISPITVINELSRERGHQDSKFGIQNHLPFTWLTIIMEELGEAAQSALQGNKSGYRKELVQTAASCIAAIECLDRDTVQI